jgi:hypothetical protein
MLHKAQVFHLSVATSLKHRLQIPMRSILEHDKLPRLHAYMCACEFSWVRVCMGPCVHKQAHTHLHPAHARACMHAHHALLSLITYLAPSQTTREHPRRRRACLPLAQDQRHEPSG